MVHTANDASWEVIAPASIVCIGTGAEQVRVACIAPLDDCIVASLVDSLSDSLFDSMSDFLVDFY